MGIRQGLGCLPLCVLGKLVVPNPQPPPLPKYLRCYRCLFETKELGCLLGSDICLVPEGSSCITVHIRNGKLGALVQRLPSKCPASAESWGTNGKMLPA